MPPQPVVLSIFVSSPGDVAEERLIAAQVIDRLRVEWAGRVELDAVFWEHEPLAATASFQPQIPRPSECDVVVTILWSRLGTRLPPDVRRADGSGYASGTEFELEDATRAYLESGRPHLLVYRKERSFEIGGRDPRADEERWRQKKALDAYLDRWLQHDDGSLRRAFHSFSGPAVLEERLETHLRALIEREWEARGGGETGGRPLWTAGSPYRGLRAFEREHAAIFCGRTGQIAAVLDLLRAQALAGRPLVLVTGRSGSGKSSLLHAGVLPTLTEPGVIEGVGGWRQAVLEPGRTGGDLVGGLARAVLSPGALEELRGEETSEEELARLLRETPTGVLPVLRAGLQRAARTIARTRGLEAPPRVRLALVVDPLDELFSDERVLDGERAAFAAALAVLVESGMVWALAAVRSDFQPRVAAVTKLGDLIGAGGLYELPPPTATEIGRMVRQPARLAGLSFDVDPLTRRPLDEVLCDEAGRDAAALPLLEFTLDELYERRTAENELTFDAYRELGGVKGALSGRAEEVVAGLGPAARFALPGVLIALVTLDEGDGTRFVRRRAPQRELLATGPGAAELVEALIAGRLLVADRAADGSPVVSLADEALLSHWPRAQTLVRDNLEPLRVRSQLQTAAALWRQQGYLIPPGPLLDRGEALVASEAGLGEDERGLLAASRAAVAAAERRHRRRRQAVAAAAGLAVALAGLGAWLWALPQSDCYVNFVKRWGVPEGIGPLDDDQVRSREWSLCFERRGRLGAVERVVAVDADGRPTPEHWVGSYIQTWQPDFADRPCSWTFEYDRAGRVVVERAHSCADQQVHEFLYKQRSDEPVVVAEFSKNGIAAAQAGSGASLVSISRSEDGLERELRYLDTTGTPRAHEGVFGLRFVAATAGPEETGAVPESLPRRLIYLDRDGQPMPSPEGCWQLDLQWNERGQQTALHCLDGEGRARQSHWGYTRTVAGYDDDGNQVLLEFRDRAGDLVSGLPVIGRTFDWQKRTIVTKFTDSTGRPFSWLGYSETSQTSTRNAGETIVVERYFDGGEPTHDGNGVAMKRSRYAEQGYLLEVTYHDEQDAPLPDLRGVVGVAHHYESGRGFQETFLDDRGERTMGSEGYAILERTVDEEGRLVAEVYRDVDGRLACNSRSFARHQLTYDGRKLTVEEYYDDRDVKAEMIDGHAAVRRSHGAGGLDELKEYLDREGERTNGPAGHPLVRHTYDRADRLIEDTYFDARGQLGNPASAQYDLDELGRTTELRYLDGDGGKAEAGGVAVERWRYGPGLSYEISRFGRDGEPAVAPGIASLRVEADTLGRETALAYLDAADNPATREDGVARRELARDRWYRVERESLRDLAGQLVVGGLGYAELEIDYDRWGRPVRQRLLDSEGEPPDAGLAEVVQEFDRWGRPERVLFLDRHRRPLPYLWGCAEWTMRYDPRGFPLELACRNGAGLAQRDAAGRGALRILRNSCGRPYALSVVDDVGGEIAYHGELPEETIAALWEGWATLSEQPSLWPLPPDAMARRVEAMLEAASHTGPAGGGPRQPQVAAPRLAARPPGSTPPKAAAEPQGGRASASVARADEADDGAEVTQPAAAEPAPGPPAGAVDDAEVDTLVAHLLAASERALEAYQEHADADGEESAAEERLYGLLDRFSEGADELTAEYRRASGRGLLRRVGVRKGEVGPEQRAAVQARLRDLAALAEQIGRERNAGAFDAVTARSWDEARRDLERITAGLR